MRRKRPLTLVATAVGGLLLVRAEAARVLHSGPPVQTIEPTVLSGPERPALAIGLDRTRRYLYSVRRDGRLGITDLSDGARAGEPLIPGLEGAAPTAAARVAPGSMAVATANGRVVLDDVDGREVHATWGAVLDAREPPARELCAARDPRATAVAGVVGRDEIAVARIAHGLVTRVTLHTLGGEPVARVAMARPDVLVAGTQYGSVYCWTLAPQPRLGDVHAAGLRGVTALGWLADDTVLVGDAAGRVSAWRVGEGCRLARAAGYAAQGGAIRAIAAADRARFAAAGGGALVLRSVARDHPLARLAGADALTDLVWTDRASSVYGLRGDGAVERYGIPGALD